MSQVPIVSRKWHRAYTKEHVLTMLSTHTHMFGILLIYVNLNKSVTVVLNK